MSTEQGKCPACGSPANALAAPYGDSWDCGSRTFNDREEFHQSGLCKLRQRDQLIAECLQVMEDYGLRHQFDCLGDVVTGDPPPGWRGCKCGATSKLAALKSRAERLKT